MIVHEKTAIYEHGARLRLFAVSLTDDEDWKVAPVAHVHVRRYPLAYCRRCHHHDCAHAIAVNLHLRET
jgi:hypothetical protein